MRNKLLSFIGLCKKSGHLVSGEFMCENTVKSAEAKLIIIAEDASSNTKKKFKNSCDYYNVPLIEIGKKEELGHFTGKDIRATIAITDEGFAKAILKRYESVKINSEVGDFVKKS